MMKRTASLLLSLLLVFLSLSCADATMLLPTLTATPTVLLPTPAPTPTLTPAPTAIPTPTPTHIVISAEEMARRREAFERYEARMAYALDTFGFHDVDYFEYLPSNIDPVCYNGRLSMNAGYKDGDSYAVYDWYAREDVQNYLGYLQYWGYEITEHECLIPGVLEWRANCPSPRNDGLGLLENVQIYHAEEQEILAVVYPYSDACLYAAWAESTIEFLGRSSTYAVELDAGCTVTIEGIQYLDTVEVVSEYEPILKPYTRGQLVPGWLRLQEPQNTYEKLWTLQAENDDDDHRVSMLCLHLSFDAPVSRNFVEHFRVAVADANDIYSHSPDVPLFCAYKNEGGFSAWTDETQATELWVIFPPRYYDPQDPKRVYMRIQPPENPWIGDLRKWDYIDLY